MSKGGGGIADAWRSESGGFESLYVASGDFGQVNTFHSLCWFNHLGRGGRLSGERSSEVRQAAAGTRSIDGDLAILGRAVLRKIEMTRVGIPARSSVNGLWHQMFEALIMKLRTD